MTMPPSVDDLGSVPARPVDAPTPQTRIREAAHACMRGSVFPGSESCAREIAEMIDLPPFPTARETVTVVDTALEEWTRARTTDPIAHDLHIAESLRCPDQGWCVRCFPNPYFLDPLASLTAVLLCVVADREDLITTWVDEDEESLPLPLLPLDVIDFLLALGGEWTSDDGFVTVRRFDSGWPDVGIVHRVEAGLPCRGSAGGDHWDYAGVPGRGFERALKEARYLIANRERFLSAHMKTCAWCAA